MSAYELPKLKCLNPKCNHEWHPRTPERPKVCPICKREDWDKVRNNGHIEK